MLLQTTIDGLPSTVSLTDRAVTISRDEHLIAAWDAGGRLYSVVDGEVTYRRGLNGRVLMKWRASGERQRAWASQPDADAIIDRAAGLAAGAIEAAAGDVVAARLAPAARFDSRAAATDAARFAAVYRPIGILPPDQYLSLVLQATEGCSFRSCTFCEFYRGAYAVRNAAAFAAHVTAVRAYLGSSLRLRSRAIFLGSANALAVPMSGLLPIFDSVAAAFPARPIHAFLDGFTGLMKDAGDYRELGARGLRRVYIGLESGHDPLLSFVRKPATSKQAVETARAVKAAGLQVGVIVMVGLGGDRFADAHIAETAAALRAMELGGGDLLYFSDLVDSAGSAYASSIEEAGILPLNRKERAIQRQAIESRLVFPATRPRIATYDIREFVY